MKKIALLFCGLLLLCSGCFSPQSVPSIDRVPVTVVKAGRGMSEVIRTAAAKKGWAASEAKPGTVRCTLLVRTHKVVVDIPYTKDSFSIHYVDSEDMEYDAQNKMINRKYIQWVRNLEKQIMIEASR